MIVRNGGQLSQLQRYLSGQGIPVRIPVAESAVRDEVAVRPLLDAYAVALDPDVLTPESAVSLLTSRIGGATSLELRRLRQSLAAGGTPGRRRTLQRLPCWWRRSLSPARSAHWASRAGRPAGSHG